MKTKVQTAARLLLGLLFFVFGLNGFLNFIPPPPQMPEAAQGFFVALMATRACPQSEERAKTERECVIFLI